jgi:hypothetical protein
VPLNYGTPGSRTPRVRALINGMPVDDVIHADVTDRGSCKSSHFELTVRAGGISLNTQWLNLQNGPVSVTISFYTQWDDTDAVEFEGLADSISFDPIRMIARIQGKDYSSVLANSSFQQSFSNQTASEIASYIATRHGFGSNITQTTTMVGSYRRNGHNQMSLNAYSHVTSEWDLLVLLAKTEGFELFIDGTSLVFSPQAALLRNYMTIDNGNAKEITFRRNCVLSDQTRVIVKSWNSWMNGSSLSSGQQTSSEAEVDFAGLSQDPGTDLVFITPNLSAQETEQLAQLYLQTLNEQNLTVDIVMPGETLLHPRDVLTVGDTGTSFDTQYVVRSLRRRFSPTGGFLQYIQGFASATVVALPIDAVTP